jgi:hypothetical protein
MPTNPSRRLLSRTVAWTSLLLLLGAPAGPEPSPPSEDPAGLAWALAQANRAEPLPTYQLHLDAKPLRKLLAFRERIQHQAFLSPDDREWVKATFSQGGERYPVKLRIRGDLPAHWRGDRLSYRVKFKDRLFRDQKEINLIVPWDKHYGIEWLQTRISEDLGVPYFPVRFVNLHINGRDAGLYLESEHPTAEYLERTGRSASSIFTFAFYWSHYFGKTHHHTAFVLPGSRELPPVQGIGQIKQRATYGSDRPLFAKKQLAYALELYRLLTIGSKQEIAARAGSYLALDNFARYVAIQDFFGSPHGMSLNDNLRLYLDSTSGKFEFMPWDTSLRPLDARLEAPGASLDQLLTPQDPVFAVLLEAVPGLRERRDHFLRRLLGDGDRYRAELNQVHARLIRLYPDDERLRTDAETFDAQLLGNLKTLERYFASAAPSVHASGVD